MTCDTIKEAFRFYTYVIKENSTINWLHLDDWFWRNQSFLFDRNLYPDRLHDVENLFGSEFRHLSAGATDYLPYSFIEPKMGMELRAVMEYSAKFNYSLTITNDEEYWGEIFENWTGTGVLGGVVTDKYDIGFSALFPLPDRIIYSDFSKPTAFSCVSCIVPAPRKVVSWLTPVKGLTPKIWATLIGTIIAVIITFKVIKKYLLGFDKSLIHIQTLSVVSMFIVQPLINTQVPMKFPLRMLYTILLVFALMITSVYNSRLASLLVIPSYEGEISTVDDLAQSGVLWGELAIDWVLPLEVDERPTYEIVYKNFRVADDDALRDIR
ncbi:uncharacterized protein [Atheta coriaria]|uniref:uncharacterized protein n=1 Tax=Dalotia coriaria TaxID=877792 RepID=UPI0031F3B644